jgi:hypothetical protein
MAKKRSTAKKATARRRTSDRSTTKLTSIDRVREHAFSMLSLRERTRTNLYADERIYQSGETIGPRPIHVVELDRP